MTYGQKYNVQRQHSSGSYCAVDSKLFPISRLQSIGIWQSNRQTSPTPFASPQHAAATHKACENVLQNSLHMAHTHVHIQQIYVPAYYRLLRKLRELFAVQCRRACYCMQFCTPCTRMLKYRYGSRTHAHTLVSPAIGTGLKVHTHTRRTGALPVRMCEQN